MRGNKGWEEEIEWKEENGKKRNEDKEQEEENGRKK